MSRMKEAAAGPGRQHWRDVRAGACPVCHHRNSTWCQVSRDGAWCLCKYVASDRKKENRDGAEYFVHRLDGAPGWTPPAGPVAPLRVRRAPPAVLAVAHGAVLDALDLDLGHARALAARGLSRTAIDRAGYRTLRLQGRARVAGAVIDAVGVTVAATVPGMHVAVDGDRRWWSFGGAPGLLVPVRDAAGHIVALKVRRDDPGDGPRYLYVSSARHDGPTADNAVHVPAFDGDRARVIITEGELKADVITHLRGVLALSIPGASAWRTVLPVLAQLGAGDAVVALDNDRFTNPLVANAQLALVRALDAGGYAPVVAEWDRAVKGYDDFLVAARGATRAA